MVNLYIRFEGEAPDQWIELERQILEEFKTIIFRMNAGHQSDMKITTEPCFQVNDTIKDKTLYLDIYLIDDSKICNNAAQEHLEKAVCELCRKICLTD